MGIKRRLGLYERKRTVGAAVVADPVADDELEAEAAEAVAAEMMSHRVVVRELTQEEIEAKEWNEVLRELARVEREERRAELERLNAISREEARRSEAAAAQRRHAEELAQASRERWARQASERAAQADRQRLAQLEHRARAADLQRQQQEPDAVKRQRVQIAYQNLMQTFDKILRPVEWLLDPMEPNDGSPHLGPDFSPDSSISRYAPWKPWQP